MDDFGLPVLEYVTREWSAIVQAPLLLSGAALAGVAVAWLALRWKYATTIDALCQRVDVQDKEIARLRADGANEPGEPPRDKHGFYLDGRQIAQVSTRPKLDNTGQMIIFATATSLIELESADHVEFRNLQLQVEGYDNRRSVGTVGDERRIGYERLRCRIIGQTLAGR
jgi:hypothetical protein